MITRKGYMSGTCTHDEYYAQFGKHLVLTVSRYIGATRIKESKDPSFNDIPLKLWDELAPFVRSQVGRMLAEANGTGGISLSDCVCAAKSAAKMIREGE